MKKKLLLSFLTGLAVSTLALYLAFRNIPIPELFMYLKRVNLFWVLPAVLLTMLCFALRALRWQLILNATHPVSHVKAYHSLIIGFMTNNVLPGRIGEALRPAILSRLSSVPFFTGMATVTVERFLDLACLIALFAVMNLTGHIYVSSAVDFGHYRLDRHTLEKLIDGTFLLALLLLGALVLMALERTRKPLVRIILSATAWPFLFFGKNGRRYRDGYFLAVENLFLKISDGFTLIRRPRRFSICAALTLVIWWVTAMSFHVISLGCPDVSLTFLETMQMMIIICFFIALPSVPGYWGLWEAGGMVALLSMGIAAPAGAGYTLINHAVQIVPVILAGLVSIAVVGPRVIRGVYTKETPATGKGRLKNGRTVDGTSR